MSGWLTREMQKARREANGWLAWAGCHTLLQRDDGSPPTLCVRSPYLNLHCCCGPLIGGISAVPYSVV
jgi:hypothetical protein